MAAVSGEGAVGGMEGRRLQGGAERQAGSFSRRGIWRGYSNEESGAARGMAAISAPSARVALAQQVAHHARKGDDAGSASHAAQSSVPARSAQAEICRRRRYGVMTARYLYGGVGACGGATAASAVTKQTGGSKEWRRRRLWRKESYNQSVSATARSHISIFARVHPGVICVAYVAAHLRKRKRQSNGRRKAKTSIGRAAATISAAQRLGESGSGIRKAINGASPRALHCRRGTAASAKQQMCGAAANNRAVGSRHGRQWRRQIAVISCGNITASRLCRA